MEDIEQNLRDSLRLHNDQNAAQLEAAAKTLYAFGVREGDVSRTFRAHLAGVTGIRAKSDRVTQRVIDDGVIDAWVVAIRQGRTPYVYADVDLQAYVEEVQSERQRLWMTDYISATSRTINAPNVAFAEIYAFALERMSQRMAPKEA